MEVVNSYFKDLIFTKVDEKEGFAIYGAGMASGLVGGVQRYTLLFVPKQYATSQQARIHDLRWQNLQTRELPYSYRLKQQPWAIPRGSKDILLHITERTKTHSKYISKDFPFEFLLLHNPKKKSLLQYHDKITLTGAIETFQMVCNYTGSFSPPSTLPSHNNLPKTYTSGGNLPNLNNWFHQNINHTTQLGETSIKDDSFEFI